MFCGNCGTQMKEEQQFCSKCGTKKEAEIEIKAEPVKQFCGNCGKELEEDEVFCGSCGTKKDEQTASIEATVEQPQQPKQSVKVKKKIGILPKLLVLLLIIAGAGYFYLYTIAKPDAVVKEFCSTMQELNYEKMFATVNLPKSEYINKEIFSEYMKSSLGSDTEVSSCEFEYIEDGSTDTKKIYEVTITADGDESTEKINVIKNDSKKYFLFDDWRVEIEDVVVDKWEISVPTGSTLFVGGKEVKDEKTTKEDTDVYIVKNLIDTEYEVKVTNPLAEDYSKKSSADKSIKVELEAKDDLEEELENYFSEFVKEFYISILQTDVANSENNTSEAVSTEELSYNDVYDYLMETYGTDIEKLYKEGASDEEIDKYLEGVYEETYKKLAAEGIAEPTEEAAGESGEPEKASEQETTSKPAESSTGIRKYMRDDKAFEDVKKQAETVKKAITNGLSYYYTDISIKNVTVSNFSIEDMKITGKDTITLSTTCKLSFDYLFNDSYNSSFRNSNTTKKLEITVVKSDNIWSIINIK